MILKFKKFIFLFWMTSISGLFAQTNKIDSLRNQFYKVRELPQQQQLILQLCSQYYSMPSDSLLRYIEIGKFLFPSKSLDYLRLQNYYCLYLNKQGRFTESNMLCDSLLLVFPKAENSEKVRLEIFATHCGILIRTNHQGEAIKNSFVLLQDAEPLKDTLALLKAYVLLGYANLELERYTEAINWLNKGCNLTKDENMLQQVVYLFSNNASCYNNINRMDSAFYFVDLALKYSRKSEHLSGLANALNIRAAMYQQQNKFDLAEADLQEALLVRKKIGDVLDVISDMGQLSSFYADINQTAKGIEVAKAGIALAQKNSNVSKLIFLKTALAENYRKTNQLENYAATLLDIINLKDSLYQKNSVDGIAEMQAKYELQKKENIIIQQEANLARNRYFNIAFFLTFILGSLFIWVLYRNYKLQQQRKIEAMLADEKINSFKAIKEAEEKERKRIAADLHDNLGSYAAAISSNVRYLLEGVPADNNLIISQLDENAKSIVSQLSDTIWVLKNEQLAITQLADRFKIWLLRIIKNYPDVKYFYEEKIETDVAFTPSEILHMFLILKECINNALKHSNCTELRIGFFSNNEVTIVIEDNGKGFDAAAIQNSNGIANIKNRAQECNWKADWLQVQPSGTRVVLTARTTN